MSVFKQFATISSAADNNIATYTTLAEGNLQLPGNGTVSFIDSGYASSLTINSTGDISGATFTITGTYNNKYITETITGPDGTTDTVYTSNLFHTITSVNSSATIAEDCTLGSNHDVAVILNSYNTINTSINNYNLKNYNVIFTANTNTDWNAEDFVAYGVFGTMPTILTKASLTFDTKSYNFFPINDVTADITAADLKSGQLVSTSYPFSGMIFYATNTATEGYIYIEIAQS